MIALATIMAVLLNSPLLKARPLYRFAFFAPVVVGEVAYAAVFRLMFSADFGIINKMLVNVGLSPISWFDNATAAMALIIIAVTWRWAGYNAIIILAGLQSIPGDVYEAARLDRVSKRQQFFPPSRCRFSSPSSSSAWCFRSSARWQLLYRTVPHHQSRRSGWRAPRRLGIFLYRQGFTSLNFGYASAIAYTIAALAIVISLFNLWVGREQK